MNLLFASARSKYYYQPLYPRYKSVLRLAEDPFVAATMFNYLYLLDYSATEPALLFSSPLGYRDSEHWEDNEIQCGSSFVSDPMTTDTDSENDQDHSEDCSSDFAVIGKEVEIYSDNQQQQTPISAHGVKHPLEENLQANRAFNEDTTHRPHPLTLHTQMYKAGVRFGIPCLAALACNKFKRRVADETVGVSELLEAVDEAYSGGRIFDEEYMDYPELKKMRELLVQAVRQRWALIKKRSDCESLVMRKPEVGRDMLRFL